MIMNLLEARHLQRIAEEARDRAEAKLAAIRALCDNPIDYEHEGWLVIAADDVREILDGVDA